MANFESIRADIEADMFRSLRSSNLPSDHVFAVTVGPSDKPTLAKWHLLEPQNVVSAVAMLVHSEAGEDVGGEAAGGEDAGGEVTRAEVAGGGVAGAGVAGAGVAGAEVAGGEDAGGGFAAEKVAIGECAGGEVAGGEVAGQI